MRKQIFLLIFVVIALLIQNPLFAWENTCPDSLVSYCANVGKVAYDNSSDLAFKGVRLGKIVGVTWREKGTIISISSTKIRNAPEDAYYYIIDNGWEEPFLRLCKEIDAK